MCYEFIYRLKSYVVVSLCDCLIVVHSSGADEVAEWVVVAPPDLDDTSQSQIAE